MYYIRYVKFPEIRSLKGKEPHYTVTTIIAITTDLGEQTIQDDVDLYANLRADSISRPILCKGQFRWTKGIRQLKIEMRVPQQHNDVNGILCITAPNRQADNLTFGNFSNGILSAWSPILSFSSFNDKTYLERRLVVTPNKIISIWEETGESIAKHIWDGGMAFISYLNQTSKNVDRLPLLNQLLSRGEHEQLQILELGSGCGLVSLILSSILHKAPDITLTDLEGAEGIISKNLASLDPEQSSTGIRFKVLDWDYPLPPWIANKRLDIVIATDCMYNSDSAQSLVSTLVGLVALSPEILIFIAYKHRHDSERLFFELMEEAGFITKNCCTFGDTVEFLIIAQNKANDVG